MRRPQSAKPGHKGYWGQGSESDFNEQQNISKGAYRKNVKLMKPDLTTNDFARILPKKIYQDKQRLYSQALQLKQNLNQTQQQNIRLKTRITILEKQKDKLTKHIEVNRQNPNMNKANSRVNIYSSKSGEKENMMIRNLKKLVREGKQENEFLKQETAKIKKAIKYTKINELQIQRKMLQDQNKRMAILLEQMNNQLSNQDSYERQLNQLRRSLEDQEQANKQLNEANLKYMEYIQQLQEKLAAEGQKAQNKQNKLQRDFALNKRKLNQANKQIEDLKKQLNNLRIQANGSKSQSTVFKAQSITTKAENQQKLTRPMSSNPYKSQGGMIGVRIATQTKKQEDNKQNQQIKNVKIQNEQLKQELAKTKIKLEETERQIKKEKEQKTDNQNQKISSKEKSSQPVQANHINKGQNSKGQDLNQGITAKEETRYQKIKQNKFEKKEEECYDQDGDEENYENQFENEQNPKNKKQMPKETAQIDQYKKDFEEQQQEEPLYIKQHSHKKKKTEQTKKNKSQRSKKDLKDDSSKKKKDKKQAGAYKPDKKILSQIKQLLTYRMKAQRYPYEQLKRDIQEAKQKQFSLTDLKGMFINQPFYLTQQYTDALVQYCFENQHPKDGTLLSNQALLTKLRKVIEQFTLIEEKQQEQMLLRIAEMVTEYPEELQTAFDKIKNGEQTVAKQDLIEMFQNLQLQHKYIELIIQQLSLCSTDLNHLNFIGFFERFYVQNMSGLQNGQIDEEQMESSSEQVSKNLKSRDTKKLKQIKAQFQDNEDNLVVDDGQKISLGNQDQQYGNDNADIVSDDGPI